MAWKKEHQELLNKLIKNNGAANTAPSAIKELTLEDIIAKYGNVPLTLQQRQMMQQPDATKRANADAARKQARSLMNVDMLNIQDDQLMDMYKSADSLNRGVDAQLSVAIRDPRAAGYEPQLRQAQASLEQAQRNMGRDRGGISTGWLNSGKSAAQLRAEAFQNRKAGIKTYADYEKLMNDMNQDINPDLAANLYQEGQNKTVVRSPENVKQAIAEATDEELEQMRKGEDPGFFNRLAYGVNSALGVKKASSQQTTYNMITDEQKRRKTAAEEQRVVTWSDIDNTYDSKNNTLWNMLTPEEQQEALDYMREVTPETMENWAADILKELPPEEADMRMHFENKGNINLYNRQPVVNEDGSVSTVYSFSVGIDDKQVLLPRVVNGKVVSEEEAIQHYFDTGENLGIFDTIEEADEYAQRLHEQQEALYTKPETAESVKTFMDLTESGNLYRTYGEIYEQNIQQLKDDWITVGKGEYTGTDPDMKKANDEINAANARIAEIQDQLLMFPLGDESPEQLALGTELAELQNQLNNMYENVDAMAANATNRLDSLRESLYGKSGLGRLVGSSIMEGFSNFADRFYKSADFILGRPINAVGQLVTGDKNWQNPLSSWTQQYGGYADQLRLESENAVQALGGGKAAATFSNALTGLVENIPNTLMAVMTGGAANAGGLGAAQAQAIETLMTSGLSQSAAQQVVTNAITNPQYWLTFMQEVGSDYQEALHDDASDTAATVYAMVSALINSQIEIGVEGTSGIQGLGQGNDGGIIGKVITAVTGKDMRLLSSILDSASDEAIEELKQGLVSGLAAKAIYDHDREWLSFTEGNNAVFNAANVGEEMLQAAITGGFLGGFTEPITNAYYDRTSDIQTGGQIIGANQAEALAGIAEDSAHIHNKTTQQIRAGTLNINSKAGQRAVGKLFRQTYMALDDASKTAMDQIIAQPVQRQLEAAGYDGDAAEAARVVAKEYHGERLSKPERAIMDDPFVSDVAAQLWSGEFGGEEGIDIDSSDVARNTYAAGLENDINTLMQMPSLGKQDTHSTEQEGAKAELQKVDTSKVGTVKAKTEEKAEPAKEETVPPITEEQKAADTDYWQKYGEPIKELTAEERNLRERANTAKDEKAKERYAKQADAAKLKREALQAQLAREAQARENARPEDQKVASGIETVPETDTVHSTSEVDTISGMVPNDETGTVTAEIYGESGRSQAELIENLEANGIKFNDTIAAAYTRGETKRRKAYAARQKEVNELKGSKLGNSVVRGVTAEEAQKYGVKRVDTKNMTEKEWAAVHVLQKLAGRMNMNVVLYETQVNEKGEHVGSNGWYDSNSETIYIDTFAGYGNKNEGYERAIMRTAAHEFTHAIEKWSPEKYRVLQDYLIETFYSKGEMTLTKLVAKQMENAERAGHPISEVDAMHEVTADAMEMMFSDANAISNLAKKDESLFTKIKNWISDLCKNIKAAMQGVEARSEEARILGEMNDRWTKIRDMWYEAFDEAAANRSGDYDDAQLQDLENAEAAAPAKTNKKVKRSVREQSAAERYAELTKGMQFDSESDAEVWARQTIPGYQETLDQIDQLHKDHSEKKEALWEEAKAWRKEHLHAFAQKQISYEEWDAGSKTEEIKALDRQYMADVKALEEKLEKLINDRYGEAQKLVDEAAAKAGYTVKAYHGTDAFGFTTFNMQLSQDEIFVAYNSDISRTYTHGADVEQIGIPFTKEQAAQMDDETFVRRYNGYLRDKGRYIPDDKVEAVSGENLREHLFSYAKWTQGKLNEVDKITTKEETKRLIKEANKALTESDPMMGVIDYYFAAKAALENEQNPNGIYTAEESKALRALGDVEEIKDMLSAIGTGRSMIAITRAWNGLTEYWFKEDLVDNVFERTQGIYQFYTRPGNQLVVDAKGSNWNKLHPEWDPQHEYKTRDIAEYARQNGYDSVRINNVFDYGGQWGDPSDGFGDIGIFFNPNDIKSADEFTFNADGSVVQLDERFSNETNDIRYSDRGTDTAREREVDMKKVTSKADAMNFGGHTDIVQYSVRGWTEATGLDYKVMENGTRRYVLYHNGKVVDKFTPDMVKNTPVGQLIDMAVELSQNKPKAEKDAKAQRKFVSDIINLMAKYQDAAMVWELAGDLTFSALKTNGDAQYSDSYDFGSICAKTQAILNTISETQLRKGRGLTKTEIDTIVYEEVGMGVRKNGKWVHGATPCPVCYVYATWVNKPARLELARRFQEQYGNWTSEQIDRFMKSKPRTGATKTETTAIEQKLNQRKLWIECCLADKVKGEDGTVHWVRRANPDFCPNEVLLDLRRSSDMATKYPGTWNFMQRGGNALGKAIAPYSDARIGESIMGKAIGAEELGKKLMTDEVNRQEAERNGTDYRPKFLNPFMTNNKAKAEEMFKDAMRNVKKQNLKGGQRWQSWSDFRAEWGSDYLMEMLTMQLLGSQVQTYTKVVEAVDLLASAGFEVNLSGMPHKDGFWHNPDGSIKRDKNGNPMLRFSGVTGIDPDAAMGFIRKYASKGNVQFMCVGISDEHIRAALASDYVTFVIPFHGSGGSVRRVQHLMSLLGESMHTGNDYTNAQTDSFADYEVVNKKKINKNPNWKLREYILEGRYNNLEPAEKEAVQANEYLRKLYQDRYVNENSEAYGVWFGHDEAQQIYPYEYWDTHTTLETADVNSQRFIEYCQMLGVIPRFSGLTKVEGTGKNKTKTEYANFSGAIRDENGNITGYNPVPGYWKLLIDRSMYNRAYNEAGELIPSESTYHVPQTVSVNDIDIGMMPKACNNTVGYENDDVREITERVLTRIEMESGQNAAAETALEADEELIDNQDSRTSPDDGIKYSLRTDPPPKKVLYAYKAFYVRDGKLYPPMVANITDETKTVEKATSGTMKYLPTPLGVWLDCDIGGIAVDENGNPIRTKTTQRLQVKNAKSGGKASLAFRPGWHLGMWPDASQFNLMDPVTKEKKVLMPDDLVFCLCEVSADYDYQLDALSYGISKSGSFNRTQAGLPWIPKDGSYMYRTNADPNTAPWLISGSMRVVEILDDDDCARICARYGITPGRRFSGKKIDLAKYGLKRGAVTPDTEGMERFMKNDAARANETLLQNALDDPNYADAYVQRPIDFNNPKAYKQLEKEFRMNNQIIDTYRDIYNERGFLGDPSKRKYSDRAVQRDEEYNAAVQNDNVERQAEMVEEAAQAAGYNIHAYHGTARADRVGTVFRPDRATSGPMAFFTDDRDIAERYSKTKRDTSISYDEDYADYYTQFRVRKGDKTIPVQDLWKSMSMKRKMQITNLAKHITFDWRNGNDESIVVDDLTRNGLGNFDEYLLREHRGNAIEALIESWLVDGNLYGSENKFLQVLKLAGITDDVEYMDPDANHEGVYDVFLRITKPFDTSTMYNMSMVNGLREWWAEQDQKRYATDGANADMWDKNNVSVDDWIERAESDLKRGTTHAWTAIPDAVTDYLKYNGYDGIVDKGGKNGGTEHTVYIPFLGEQVKSAEPITRDLNGEVIPLSERFNIMDNDIRYSNRDPEFRTDRQILAEALEGAAANEEERKLLADYQMIAKDLDAKNKRVDDLNEQIRNMRLQEPGTEEEQNLVAERNRLQREINTADKQLMGLQRMEPMRRIAKDERKKAENDLERAKAHMQRYREGIVRREYIGRIDRTSKRLTKWLAAPAGKSSNYVPESLRRPLGEFLLTINKLSERSLSGGPMTQDDRKFANQLQMIDMMLRGIEKGRTDDVAEQINEQYGAYIDLPYGFTDTLTQLVTRVQDRMSSANTSNVLNEMSVDELEALDMTMTAISSSITHINDFLSGSFKASVSETAEKTINDMREIKSRRGNLRGLQRASDFVYWDNVMPVYAFERMGEGGRAIFKALRDGQDKLAFNAKRIIDLAGEMYTAEEAQEWVDKIIEFTDPATNEKIQMSAAHLMSLYALSKRAQALGHLMGEGYRVADIKRKGKTITDKGHVLNAATLKRMTDTLTDRQKEVADNMVRVMSTIGADWGNYVSMRRFGYKQFTEDSYFPIKSDSDLLPAKTDTSTGNELYKLLNMSMTKPLVQKANNRIMLENIFDVFAGHMADMAQYNAMALPVLDAVKWLNYKASEQADGEETRYTDGVRDSIRDALGTPAVKYLTEMLKDVNGGGQVNDTGVDLTQKMLGRYNRVAVAANLRVALLQPLAIIRAANELPGTSLAKGTIKAVPRIRAEIAEMQEKSGIALWKSLGYRETNIGRSVKQQIQHMETLTDKISDKSMILAELGDQITWASMWKASKEYIRKHRNDLLPGSDEFFKAVTDKFEDVIYNTQVVDSILTKSQLMRSSKTTNRMLSSFMSEPTTTFNTLMRSWDKIRLDMLKGKTFAEAWQKNGLNMGKTALIFLISAAVETVISQLMSAYRDDDDYETFKDKVLDGWEQTFADNVNPLTLLPGIKQLYEAGIKPLLGMETFDDQNVLTEGISTTVKGIQKIMNGQGTVWGRAYTLAKGISMTAGIPIHPVMREFQALWNNSVVRINPSWRLETSVTPQAVGYDLLYKAYTTGDTERVDYLTERLNDNGYSDEKIQSAMTTRIKKETDAGDITAEEAQKRLQQMAGMDENAAYYKAQQMTDDDGSYSRFDNLEQAIKTGAGYKEAVDELTSHGYAAKDVESKARSIITKMAIEDNMSETAVQNLLKQYGNMDANEAYIRSQELRYQQLTGNSTTADAAMVFYAIDNKQSPKAAIDGLKQHGKDAKSIASSVSSKYKSQYLDLVAKGKTSEAAALKGRLITVFDYLGVDGAKRLADWEKDK